MSMKNDTAGNDFSVRKVVVIGAGTMGSGIAGVFARAQRDVVLVDMDQALLNRGMSAVKTAQNALEAAGLLSAAEASAALGRITTFCELDDACAECDLVIEAITENLDVKRALFRRLETLCPSRTLFATNTSGLSITKIAGVTERPERTAGMHFWNPPHIIPLVEITRGADTSEETATVLMGLCREIGKRPILVQSDIPGFVGNRLQFAVLREALHLVSEGIVTAEDVDTAMTAGPGLRYGCMGPLRTADFGGLDVFSAISTYLFKELDASQAGSSLLADYVEKNQLGAKSGSGFYRYAADEISGQIAKRDRILLGFLDVLNREEQKRRYE